MTFAEPLDNPRRTGVLTMRIVHQALVSAAFALYGVLAGAGCLAEQEPQVVDEATAEATDDIGGYSASLFAFATTVVDDGQGEAGGWQVAAATLNFRDFSWTLNPKSWQRSIKVEMPVRSTTNGVIQAEWASQISAPKATDASSIVLHSRDQWPIAEVFCKAFAAEMTRGLRLWEPAAKVNKA
jgi:hypothetical protein